MSPLQLFLGPILDRKYTQVRLRHCVQKKVTDRIPQPRLASSGLVWPRIVCFLVIPSSLRIKNKRALPLSKSLLSKGAPSSSGGSEGGSKLQKVFFGRIQKIEKVDRKIDAWTFFLMESGTEKLFMQGIVIIRRAWRRRTSADGSLQSAVTIDKVMFGNITLKRAIS